jgi:Zn-finger nucleic acid-binding protein
MNCPQCDAEMTELVGSDESIQACAECGQWIDGTQLNALLLHSNLAGVASLGGRLLPDESTGTCPGCRVSLARLEQNSGLFYEVCEECGFVFFPFDPPAAVDFDAARKRFVAAAMSFSGKKPRAST